MELRIVEAVQSAGLAWLPAAELASALIAPVPWLFLAILGLLFIVGKHRLARDIFISSVAGFTVIFSLKYFIQGPRPYWVYETVVQHMEVLDYGMPSWHAFWSLLLIGMLWLRHPKSLVLTLGGVFLVLAVGFSRIYLGVHFLSQVAAGWALALLALALYQWIDRRFSQG